MRLQLLHAVRPVPGKRPGPIPYPDGPGLPWWRRRIAWKQGVDLFGAAGSRLVAGYEYTAKYNLGHEVPYERFVSFEGRYDYKEISERGRCRFAPIYEIVYRHYHGRMGVPITFTAQVIEKTRPEEASTTHSPWASLMFASVPSK